jgi:hypothetical protein
MKMTNKEFAKKDERFLIACYIANISPTTRQAGKFRRGKGLTGKIRAAQINQELIRRHES